MTEVLAGVRPVLNGRECMQRPLAPYRSQILAQLWSKKQLPASVSARNAVLFQHATQPTANSANWIGSLLDQMGLDRNTPLSNLTPNYRTGHTDSMLWLRREGEYFYVVDSAQPLRHIVDQDVTTPTSTARFNGIISRLGGLPVPLDAKPHTTADRYTGVIQPDENRLISLYSFSTTDPATTTIELTTTLTSGSTHLTINYGDNAVLRQDWLTQTPVQFNATAADVKASIDGAKNATGALFTAGASGIRCQAAGGPLNSEPIVLTFVFTDPMTPAAISITPGTNTLSPGGLTFTHHNSGPYDRCRRGAIVTPSDDGSITAGMEEFTGTYTTKTGAGGFVWMDSQWPGTATGIEMFGLVPSWEEAEAANAAGTGLGHALPMVVGHAQHTPIGQVYPAVRNDGDKNSLPAYIAEGAHIALPPDVDLSYIQANCPEFLFVPRTLRDNGAVIIDKTGSGCEIIFRRAQWFGSSFNPWADILTRYATQGSSAAHFYMKSIPWHKAGVIDPAYFLT